MTSRCDGWAARCLQLAPPSLLVPVPSVRASIDQSAHGWWPGRQGGSREEGWDSPGLGHKPPGQPLRLANQATVSKSISSPCRSSTALTSHVAHEQEKPSSQQQPQQDERTWQRRGACDAGER